MEEKYNKILSIIKDSILNGYYNIDIITDENKTLFSVDGFTNKLYVNDSTLRSKYKEICPDVWKDFDEKYNGKVREYRDKKKAWMLKDWFYAKMPLSVKVKTKMINVDDDWNVLNTTEDIKTYRFKHIKFK